MSVMLPFADTRTAPLLKRKKRCLIMNPGSPTFPRTILGPTCGRIVVSDGSVVDAEIIQLDPPGADK